MRYALITLLMIVGLFGCQPKEASKPTQASIEATYLKDPLILPIAKEYYQGKKPAETPQTLDMLDSLFIQDSVRLRFYFAATTKLISQPMNFRDIVSLYAFKFVRDRPLMFIAQFTEENPLINSNDAWGVWCLNIAYEAIQKNPKDPFKELDVIETSMKNRFRTVSINAMEMGGTFIENTRAKIIKLQYDQKQDTAPKKDGE